MTRPQAMEWLEDAVPLPDWDTLSIVSYADGVAADVEHDIRPATLDGVLHDAVQCPSSRTGMGGMAMEYLKETTSDLIARVRRIAGHVAAVERELANVASCETVLHGTPSPACIDPSA
jgi:hypothetical protein